MTVDEKTGHLWVGQNGQDLWEQAYLVKKGDNYGWSVTEGSHQFYPNRKPGPTPFVKPTVEHHHSEARSLTGGIVYYGTEFPELHGAYIYGDYSTGKIWGVKHDGTKIVWHKEMADTRLQITGFGADSQGEILIARSPRRRQGRLLHAGADAEGPQPVDVPTQAERQRPVSQSVKGHVMEPALIPYSVNAPLWSRRRLQGALARPARARRKIDFTTLARLELSRQDGAGQIVRPGDGGGQRRLAPLDRDALPHQASRANGSATPTPGTTSRPKARWSKAQGRGPRLHDQGAEVRRSIPTASRKQTWHYPSRTECMVCHSRAANWVLGLSECR